MEDIIMSVFWSCALLVGYAYLGYPVAVWCLARLFGRKRADRPIDTERLPSVSLLIAAYNEEAEIEQRIQNALAMDYPADRLEIVIASDGSSDATPSIVRRYAERGVRLLDYHQRRGKAAVLNSAFSEVNGEIVVLSDANTHFHPGALRRLTSRLADPQVGVVCGRLILNDPETGRNVDGLYWKYETFLKKNEGRLGALLGANGAIYAIRRDLYRPIPDGTIVDDFVIPLQAKLRTGCSIVYDNQATAHEETPRAIGVEFHRRSRIGAGGFQSVGLLWRLLDPRRGWIAFTFFSHKILRWLCPFFLLALLGSNILLVERRLHHHLLLAQLGFYLVAALAAFLPPRLKLLKPLRLATMFTGMNMALLIGYWRYLCGWQKGVWKPTARLAQASV
jgi:cellulose synthase/poly-beta-1,6-N-acetylglucosamine synthase-like glycosyltransferase